MAMVDDSVLTVQCEDYMFDPAEGTLILNGAAEGSNLVANFMNLLWFAVVNKSEEDEDDE